jgi:hypothetical protein
MLNSDSLDAMLHSCCDDDVLGWKMDAGILSGLKPSISAIVWDSGATDTVPPSDDDGSSSTVLGGDGSGHDAQSPGSFASVPAPASA